MTNIPTAIKRYGDNRAVKLRSDTARPATHVLECESSATGPLRVFATRSGESQARYAASRCRKET